MGVIVIDKYSTPIILNSKGELKLMATMTSYDLNGKKLSFANWISNLSPTDTPFVSMTGKEAIQQTLFQ